MRKTSKHTVSLLIFIFIGIAVICFSIYFAHRPIIWKKDESRSLDQLVFVFKVVDGDTIDVMMDNKKTPVRLIGINAPEIYQGKKPECYATEAAEYVKNRIENQRIRLVSDSSQTDKDIYNRLLRFIFLEDGTNLDLELIQQGYAKEYTYKIPYQYQKEFRNAQANAKIEKKGLWGNCATIMK